MAFDPGSISRGTSTRPERPFDRSPAVAIWEVTRACDLACRHCRASAMAARDPRELDSSESLDLVDQLAELAPGVLVLTGGDPLKRPDLTTIVERAATRDLAVALAPSVTPLLTGDAIRRLAGAGAQRVALSLDGPDPATHDDFRGMPGAFAATLRAVDDVRAAGLSLQINTSLSRRTVDRLEGTGALVVGFAPALWSVFFVVPVGRAALGDQLDPETCERVFHWLYDWTTATDIPLKTTAAPAYRRVVVQRRKTAPNGAVGARRPLAVNDGKGFVFVSHVGDVYPSGFLPLRAGNVRDQRLAHIYRESDLFRALREDGRLEGKCGRCQFWSLCGGSRARSYAATGNPFAEDPACAFIPPPGADERLESATGA